MTTEKKYSPIDEGYWKRPYDVAVIIGRFQPPHNGHGVLFKKALEMARNLHILTGSANRAPDIENPFEPWQRAQMLRDFIPVVLDKNKPGFKDVCTQGLNDYMYVDDAWMIDVQAKVKEFEERVRREQYGWKDKPQKIRTCLIGNMKADTSYLTWFPQWDYIGVEDQALDMNATQIRAILFGQPERFPELKALVPNSTYTFLEPYINSPEHLRISEEWKMIEKYKESWKAAPYAPTLLTADALVVKNGHILMVTRKHAPGKGLLALPGGFVNQNESIRATSVREAYEETSLDIPPAVLKGSFVATEVFDHPKRSKRGRTVTHAFLYRLDGHDRKLGLPRIKAADDAEKVQWIPISEIEKNSRGIFEDHADIIGRMLSLY